MFKKLLIILIGLVLVISSIVIAADYHEAPELTEKVASGELPSLEERLPEDPFIVEPIDEIGKYGGIARVVSTIPEGLGDDVMLMPVYTALVRPNPDNLVMEPHLAHDMEVSADARVYTISLRKGLKWSDGEPYTADDIMFWYNNVLYNKELTPSISNDYKSDGEVMEVKKIDDYTLQFNFAQPKPFFDTILFTTGLHLYPEHYMKQFHPAFVPEEELEQKIDEAGYDHWYELFSNKGRGWAAVKWNPECPSLSPYVLEEMDSSSRQWVRNPYFWKVDTAGNQLPYINGIDCEIVANTEVAQGQIISGEIDFANWVTDLTKYPMYKKYEEQGGFKTYVWQHTTGTYTIRMLNLTHEDPVLRKIFQDVRFRRALSIGMDREEINEAIYFNQAEPRQYTVVEQSKYYEPEFAQSYVEFDPERANELLDEMGLDERDREGFRLKPDGERLKFTLTCPTHIEQRFPSAELSVQHWRENLGLDINIETKSGELLHRVTPANKLDSLFWGGGNATDIFFPKNPQFLVPVTPPAWSNSIWPEWQRWFVTDGEKGEEPPAHVKDLQNWWQEMVREGNKEKRIELGKKILASQAENLWVIGDVGKAPIPYIVNKDLRNVRKSALWGWDVHWNSPYDPSQYYFDRD